MDFITDDANHHRQNYLGRVRYIDASFGRLMTQLEQRGMYENAVIVMHADNGAAIWDFLPPPPPPECKVCCSEKRLGDNRHVGYCALKDFHFWGVPVASSAGMTGGLG